MAKIRLLKKDIDFVTHLVVTECFDYLLEFNDKNKEEVYKLINNAVAKENELIRKVNHPEGEPKKHFRAIREELAESAKQTLDDLEKLR